MLFGRLKIKVLTQLKLLQTIKLFSKLLSNAEELDKWKNMGVYRDREVFNKGQPTQTQSVAFATKQGLL